MAWGMGDARLLRDWATAMRAAGLAEATVEVRRSALRQLARRGPLLAAGRGDLEGWLATPGWSPQTRSSYRQHVRAFYGWAVDCGLLDADPAARLARVRVPRGQPRPASEDVVARVLMTAGPRVRLAVELAAYMGLRRAEAAAVHASHVEGGLLRVKGKGGHTRLVPVHPVLAERLALLEGWAFPSRKGGHLSAEALGVLVSDALGPAYSMHCLRHRFATRAYAATHDIRAVQRLLGHASIATTERYVQVDDAALVEAVRSVA